jgi:hypothetical protein
LISNELIRSFCSISTLGIPLHFDSCLRFVRFDPIVASRGSCDADAELPEQGVMALSGHRTPQAARLYVKRTDAELGHATMTAGIECHVRAKSRTRERHADLGLCIDHGVGARRAA